MWKGKLKKKEKGQGQLEKGKVEELRGGKARKGEGTRKKENPQFIFLSIRHCGGRGLSKIIGWRSGCDRACEDAAAAAGAQRQIQRLQGCGVKDRGAQMRRTDRQMQRQVRGLVIAGWRATPAKTHDQSWTVIGYNAADFTHGRTYVEPETPSELRAITKCHAMIILRQLIPA